MNKLKRTLTKEEKLDIVKMKAEGHSTTEIMEKYPFIKNRGTIYYHLYKAPAEKQNSLTLLLEEINQLRKSIQSIEQHIGVKGSKPKPSEKAVEIKTESKKLCQRCKKEKPLHDFYPHNKNNSGYQAYCKECNETYQTEYRKRKNAVSNVSDSLFELSNEKPDYGYVKLLELVAEQNKNIMQIIRKGTK